MKHEGNHNSRNGTGANRLRKFSGEFGVQKENLLKAKDGLEWGARLVPIYSETGQFTSLLQELC